MPSVVVSNVGAPPVTGTLYQRSHSSFGTFTGKTTLRPAHFMLLSDVNTLSRGALRHTRFASPEVTSAIMSSSAWPAAKVAV